MLGGCRGRVIPVLLVKCFAQSSISSISQFMGIPRLREALHGLVCPKGVHMGDVFFFYSLRENREGGGGIDLLPTAPADLAMNHERDFPDIQRGAWPGIFGFVEIMKLLREVLVVLAHQAQFSPSLKRSL